MTFARLRQKLPHILLFARYFLPVLTGVLLLVLSFFYNVYYYQLGSRYVQSLFHFYSGTFTAMKEYLGGGHAGLGAFYTWLTVGALAGVLCFILAATFSVFAFLPSLAVFAGKPATQEKLRFKILFPNRVCLFLSSCLYLPTALFPQFFSWVCRRAGENTEMIFVEISVPLIVTAVLILLTLALAVYARFAERTEPHYDPFVLEVALPEEDKEAVHGPGAGEEPPEAGAPAEPEKPEEPPTDTP